jgi:predicted Zn-dependent protease
LAVLSLASPSVALAAPKNPYDGFRNRTYSNKGLMDEQQEMQIGAQVHQQVLQKYRLVQDPEVTAYVQQLGERLARASRRPDIYYRFFVIDDQSVNAFALPGGFVYVNRGLIDIAQGEDELAAAMAHEIGHVAARHGLKNIKKAQRTALLFGILGVGADIFTGGSGAGRAASEIFAAGMITKYSRDFEREADYLGLYNMTAVGYPPDAMVRIFQRLAQNAGRAQSSIGGIFASHPDSGERVKNTEIEIQQHFANRVARSSDGSTRARRVGQSAPQSASQGAAATYAATNNGQFMRIKQALAQYRGGYGGYGNNYPTSYPSGRRSQRNRGGIPQYDPNGYPQGNYPNNYPQNNPQYDPNDPANQPAQNDRPVLRRRP